MPLSKEQISTLLNLVATTTEDKIACDGCLKEVAQFAETELLGRSMSESMLKIKNHMQNCPCCEDEYNALLDAVAHLDISESPAV